MNDQDWNTDGDWGELPRINPRDKQRRLSISKTREENVLNTLSKNTLGFNLQRYSVYNSNGREISQTIITKKGYKLRCPDIYATHPSSWDDVSLRIELKTHDTLFDKSSVRIEKDVFDDYQVLQSLEEVETRIVFFIIDGGKKYWQTLDVLDENKVLYKKTLNGKIVYMYYWDTSTFEIFTTADEFFQNVQI